MPNPDGTPDSIAEALARPQDFTGVPADADQSVAHRDLGLPRHYEGLLPGQRPYGWKCPGCGNDQYGHVEDGCSRCGAGKDGKVGKPEVAVDPICRACRGLKTISIKCKQCDGSGEMHDNDDIEACMDCGGAGTLTVDCRRCGGTGFDPEPRSPQPMPLIERMTEQAIMEQQKANTPITSPGAKNVAFDAVGHVVQELTGMARIMSEKPLPTLEDEPTAMKKPPKVFLMEVAEDGVPFLVQIGYTAKVKKILDEARVFPQ